MRAVLNAAESSDGRYPNTGPLMLARAGICLIDVPGGELFERLRDGDPVTIEGGAVIVGGHEVANGRLLGAVELEQMLDEQRERVNEALSEFVENTVAHVRQETDLLTGSIEFPRPVPPFAIATC